MTSIQHQYVERATGRICTEPLFWDKTIQFLYSKAREKTPTLFRALTGARASSLLSIVNYDLPFTGGMRSHLSKCGVDMVECLDPPHRLKTAQEFFERKIRYWDCRPMPDNEAAVVSPADSKVIVGSLTENTTLFVKEKFFALKELLGGDKLSWITEFRDADFAIFRLTPDKYHYNHTPAAGAVKDFYTIEGAYHSCNPSAVVALATPYSKNKRVVTIIDTDVPRGTGIGLVAMIEVVALMIGEVVQLYSGDRYEDPRPVSIGMFLEKGFPKSLYRPGSSTTILLFQKGRVSFSEDLVRNVHRTDVQSRFSSGFGQPLVETDLCVRSLIGQRGTHVE